MDDKTVEVYPEFYVVDYGEKKVLSQIKKNLYVSIKTLCQSHGSLWYECWDGNTDEYIGWISEEDCTMHNRFFRYEEYETPLSGIVTGSKSGDVFGYTSDFILKQEL